MFQCKRSLDQADDTRRCIGVADIRFHRADATEIFALGEFPESIGQRGHFDRITDRRARAMTLYIADTMSASTPATASASAIAAACPSTLGAR